MSPLRVGSPRRVCLPSDWGSLRQDCVSPQPGLPEAGLCLPSDWGSPRAGLCEFNLVDPKKGSFSNWNRINQSALFGQMFCVCVYVCPGS